MSLEYIDEAVSAAAAAHGVTGATPGFSIGVMSAREVVFEGAVGLADVASGRAIRPGDNFVIASNTKQLCCLCVLMLAERGLVDLDAPVRRFFPDFPDYVDRVSVAQMMAHTSGIPDYFEEGFAEGFPDELRALAKADLPRMLGYVRTLGGLEFEPDHGWAYSNSTYLMLGDIVRQLTGEGFGHFLESEVLRPLGMDRSFAPDDYVSRDPWLVNGYSRREGAVGRPDFVEQPYDMLMVGFADGNVSSNVDDMLRWHRWLYEGEGPDLVRPETKALLFRDRTLADGRRTGYGLGLSLGLDGSACDMPCHLEGQPEVWHSGSAAGFVSVCSRFTERNLSVAMLTNDDGIARDDIFRDVCRAILA